MVWNQADMKLSLVSATYYFVILNYLKFSLLCIFVFSQVFFCEMVFVKWDGLCEMVGTFNNYPVSIISVTGYFFFLLLLVFVLFFICKMEIIVWVGFLWGLNELIIHAKSLKQCQQAHGKFSVLVTAIPNIWKDL